VETDALAPRARHHFPALMDDIVDGRRCREDASGQRSEGQERRLHDDTAFTDVRWLEPDAQRRGEHKPHISASILLIQSPRAESLLWRQIHIVIAKPSAELLSFWRRARQITKSLQKSWEWGFTERLVPLFSVQRRQRPVIGSLIRLQRACSDLAGSGAPGTQCSVVLSPIMVCLAHSGVKAPVSAK